MVLKRLMVVIVLSGLGVFVFLFYNSPMFVFWNGNEKKVVKKYYDNLIKEKYEDNYELLNLFDKYSDMSVSIPGSEAKEIYLNKVSGIKDTNYRVLNYSNLRFLKEDFVKFADLIVTVEINGEKKNYREDIQITKDDKLLVDYSEDPMSHLRDGDIRKENSATTGTGGSRDTLGQSQQ